MSADDTKKDSGHPGRPTRYVYRGPADRLDLSAHGVDETLERDGEPVAIPAKVMKAIADDPTIQLESSED